MRTWKDTNYRDAAMCWLQWPIVLYIRSVSRLSKQHVLTHKVKYKVSRRLLKDCMIALWKRPFFTVTAKMAASFSSAFQISTRARQRAIQKDPTEWKFSKQIQISLQSSQFVWLSPTRSRRCSLSKSTSQATTTKTTPRSLQCETLWVTAHSIDPLQESQSWTQWSKQGQPFLINTSAGRAAAV